MTSKLAVPTERIERRILLVRGHKVMLDADLAELYGIEIKVLSQTDKRNREGFPPDVMFRLTRTEKSEVVTDCDHLGRLYFCRLAFALIGGRATVQRLGNRGITT